MRQESRTRKQSASRKMITAPLSLSLFPVHYLSIFLLTRYFLFYLFSADYYKTVQQQMNFVSTKPTEAFCEGCCVRNVTKS